MGKFLYIVYEWTDRTIKVISCNRDKAYAKVGEDFLAGENIDDYHVIEVNLEGENLLQEMAVGELIREYKYYSWGNEQWQR